MTPEEFEKWVEEDSRKEEIYEPKYGGKDHSGYDTMMKYEINYERSEAAENCATRLFNLLSKEISEKDEEISRLSTIRNFFTTGTYWKERCEAAEYLLAPDASTELPKEYQKWKKLKNNQL